MKFIRLFTGKDEQSHFSDFEPEFFTVEYGKLTHPINVNSIIFGDINIEEVTWHNTPCKQYIIMLQGAMEIEVGDGTKEIFYEGDVLLAEDITGQGHITRAASEVTRRYLTIPLK